eukprot:GILK01005169.1.p1 GENE.GILK01005169.1~~GILK01005169.1.p1  ORF type:complete len:857 (+),score=143.90 GILK01005169.1:190-2760(+)
MTSIDMFPLSSEASQLKHELLKSSLDIMRARGKKDTLSPDSVNGFGPLCLQLFCSSSEPSSSDERERVAEPVSVQAHVLNHFPPVSDSLNLSLLRQQSPSTHPISSSPSQSDSSRVSSPVGEEMQQILSTYEGQLEAAYWTGREQDKMLLTSSYKRSPAVELTNATITQYSTSLSEHELGRLESHCYTRWRKWSKDRFWTTRACSAPAIVSGTRGRPVSDRPEAPTRKRRLTIDTEFEKDDTEYPPVTTTEEEQKVTTPTSVSVKVESTTTAATTTTTTSTSANKMQTRGKRRRYDTWDSDRYGYVYSPSSAVSRQRGSHTAGTPARERTKLKMSPEKKSYSNNFHSACSAVAKAKTMVKDRTEVLTEDVATTSSEKMRKKMSYKELVDNFHAFLAVEYDQSTIDERESMSMKTTAEATATYIEEFLELMRMAFKDSHLPARIDLISRLQLSWRQWCDDVKKSVPCTFSSSSTTSRGFMSRSRRVQNEPLDVARFLRRDAKELAHTQLKPRPMRRRKIQKGALVELDDESDTAEDTEPVSEPLEPVATSVHSSPASSRSASPSSSRSRSLSPVSSTRKLIFPIVPATTKRDPPCRIYLTKTADGEWEVKKKMTKSKLYSQFRHFLTTEYETRDSWEKREILTTWTGESTIEIVDSFIQKLKRESCPSILPGGKILISVLQIQWQQWCNEITREQIRKIHNFVHSPLNTATEVLHNKSNGRSTPSEPTKDPGEAEIVVNDASLEPAHLADEEIDEMEVEPSPGLIHDESSLDGGESNLIKDYNNQMQDWFISLGKTKAHSSSLFVMAEKKAKDVVQALMKAWVRVYQPSESSRQAIQVKLHEAWQQWVKERSLTTTA